MTIPETQLETWGRHIRSDISERTANSIKATLRSGSRSTVRQLGFDVYLQGSYANHTNIRADSDVDVVVEFNSIFHYDIDNLSSEETVKFLNWVSRADYTLDKFRREVIATLRAEYGHDSVIPGNKAILVKGNGYRLDADVLVCAEFRRWDRFHSNYAQEYVEGICFWTQNPPSRRVVNFPKLHRDNGAAKNTDSREWFKKTVRMYKHARNRLVEKRIIGEGVAPSYFIENLLYNLPSGAFGNTYQQDFGDCLNSLETLTLSTCVCQHRQWMLFGDSPEQWDINDARTFIRGIRYLWDNWYTI